MKKLTDYTDRCGTCIHYKRMVKDGLIQEHGICYGRGKLAYHNSSQKCCRKYEVKNDEI